MSHVGEYAPRWSVAPASDAICGTPPMPEFTRFSGLQWQSNHWASDCGLVEWSSRSIHCASEERGLTATQKHLSLQFSVGSDIVRVDNTFSVAAYLLHRSMAHFRAVNVNRVVPALWVVAARMGGLPDV